MIARLIVCGAALSLLTLQLPSCSFNMNVESMLTPPRLTAEQEQIYQALLRDTGGTQVSLKYPKSGERLSAFIVEDLDNDGSDEAIVFYQTGRTTPAENPLRIGLLDQENGEWTPVRNYTTPGAEVERVDITKLGTDPHTNLIISYSMVDGADYQADVLIYENRNLVSRFGVPYSAMALQDLDQNGTQELFIANAAKGSTMPAAFTYSFDENGEPLQSMVNLPETFTGVTRLVYSAHPTGVGSQSVPAIYMDCLTGATQVQTIVLTFEQNRLAREYTDSAAPDRPGTQRPGNYQTMDIDGDGEAEIPANTTPFGFDKAENKPAIEMTKWYVCRGGSLMQKYTSYYAAQDGYVFLMPKRWERRVTVVQEEGETVFYTYDPNDLNPDGSPVLQEPLLRLAVVTDLIAADAMQPNGYLLLRQQDGRYYLGKAESGNRKLSLSASELMFAMRFL